MANASRNPHGVTNYADVPAVGWCTIRNTSATETTMFKGGLLWLLGIPIPVILVLLLLGVL
jgi:hypothetical protein